MLCKMPGALLGKLGNAAKGQAHAHMTGKCFCDVWLEFSYAPQRQPAGVLCQLRRNR